MVFFARPQRPVSPFARPWMLGADSAWCRPFVCQDEGNPRRNADVQHEKKCLDDGWIMIEKAKDIE